MKEKTLKALRIVPQKLPEIVSIPNTLAALQQEVGGLIDVVAWDCVHDSVCYIINDEGKLDNLPPNRALLHDGKIFDVIAGTFLVVGDDGEDFCSLDDAMLAKYYERFAPVEYYAFD